MSSFKTTISFLKRYCENCTIAGLAYIANRRLHFTERIFWLLCIIISTIGASMLVNQYRMDFEKKAVSIVYDSLPLNAKIKYPTVSVCNVYQKNIIPRGVEDYIKSVCKVNCNAYDYESEGQLLMFIYPHLYHEGLLASKCEKLKNCAKCNKCITEERIFLEEFSFNCTELFVGCSASGESFDCCHYFRPFITPLGKCYLLNSLQNNKPTSEHWFHKEVDTMVELLDLKIVTSMSVQVSVLNAEDVPSFAMPGISVSVVGRGQSKRFHVYMQKTINDLDVRDVSPEYRKCRFPDEVLPKSIYKAHSFSACLNDCIRQHQLTLCNCALQTMVPEANPDNPACSLECLLLLENKSMIKPDPKTLLPSNKASKLTCECLPSCTENEISAVYESRATTERGSPNYTVTIAMPEIAREHYRRQALRTRLDIVVTIGGILGLFLGASIISGIELLYYLVLWILSLCTAGRDRRQNLKK